MKKRFERFFKAIAITVIASLLGALIFGCQAGDNNSVAPSKINKVATLTVRQTDVDGNVEFLDGSGQVLTQDQLAAVVNQISDDPGSGIDLQMVANSDNKAIVVGCYRVMFRWDYPHYVPCARRNVRHLQFHIRNTCRNYDVVNLGVAGWNNGSPQFAVFNEAGSGFCFNSTGKFTAVRDSIVKSLAIVGITGVVAYILANAIASVSVAAFAF